MRLGPASMDPISSTCVHPRSLGPELYSRPDSGQHPGCMDGLATEPVQVLRTDDGPRPKSEFRSLRDHHAVAITPLSCCITSAAVGGPPSGPDSAAGASQNRPMQQDVPRPNWATWRELMQRSRRSVAGKLAGVWALKVLEEVLGPRWPEDIFDSAGSVPSEVFGFAYAYEFARLLELALRLTMLRSTPGYGKVRRDLRRDHRHERRHHSMIQLEIAGLAMRLGLDPAMEVAIADGGGPADVRFTTTNGTIAAETRVVLRDASSRAAEADWDRLTTGLLPLEANHGVVFGGGLDFVPAGSELEEL